MSAPTLRAGRVRSLLRTLRPGGASITITVGGHPTDPASPVKPVGAAAQEPDDLFPAPPPDEMGDGEGETDSDDEYAGTPVTKTQKKKSKTKKDEEK